MIYGFLLRYDIWQPLSKNVFCPFLYLTEVLKDASLQLSLIVERHLKA
jgi:hypothetical protein